MRQNWAIVEISFAVMGGAGASLSCGLYAQAEEPPPALAPATSKPVPSSTPPPASTNALPQGSLPPVAVPLAARDSVTHYLTRERVQDLQERIRPSIINIEARGGAGRYLWSQRRQPSSMLQLINPFAPSDLGVSSVTYYQVPPTVAQGQPPLPRAFRDAESHEAGGVFLRSGW